MHLLQRFSGCIASINHFVYSIPALGRAVCQLPVRFQFVERTSIPLERFKVMPANESHDVRRGSVNEIPDRISDGVGLIGVGIAAGSWGLGAIAALAAVATAYVRAVGKASGAASDFCGPWPSSSGCFSSRLRPSGSASRPAPGAKPLGI